MLGFRKSDSHGAVTVAEGIVDELDAEFSGWRDDQKDAFAQVLCRLLPKIAAEGNGLAGLPLDRVAAVIKRNFWRFLPQLVLRKGDAMAELGRAFMTRGARIRDFCARTAQTIPELQSPANDNAGAVVLPLPVVPRG